MEVLSAKEITQKFSSSSINKINKPLITTILLGILAGAFIGLGAIFYMIVKVDPTYSFATKQILGGFLFCVGLILVIVAGAELFTGNLLIAVAVANKKVSPSAMLKNLIIIFFTNMIGAVGLAFLVFYSGHLEMHNGDLAKLYVKVAEHKASLPFGAAFLKGLMCNILVCLAVWLAAGGKSLTDKVIAIIFPITLFVAAGFEHSIANLFIIPLGMIANTFMDVGITTVNLGISGLFNNLLPVVLGNIVGGLIVSLFYFNAFRSKLN